MTEQKKKAKELIEKFSPLLPYYSKNDNLNKSKQCAILCVDDEIKILQKLKNKLRSVALISSTFEVMYLIDELQEVRNEIINYKK